MSARPGIAVVVCCYAHERFEDVLACIGSLHRQTAEPEEIVLVVDHNVSLLERMRAALPDTRIVANTDGKGLSGARNTGVAQTRAPIVAFLDDDAAAEPDWLEHLAAAYADEHVVGVGGSIRPAWEAARPRWFPEEFDWVVGCTYRGLPADRAAVRNLIGANMSFRRTALEAAGGFALGMGRNGSTPAGNNEDTEMSIRVRRSVPGSALVFEPAAVVRHRVPRGRSVPGYFVRRCFAEGRAKALLAGVAGTREGLESERAYTVRTLPAGAVRGVADCVFRRNPAGLGRSAAIVTGLVVTTIGYAAGRVRARTSPPMVEAPT